MPPRRRAGAHRMPPIQKLSKIKPSANILVYSDPGVGKTVMAGTADKGLIIAIDKGTISAARQGSLADAVICQNWQDFEEVQKYLRAGHWQDYDWLSLDSLSSARDKCMRYCLDRAKEDNPKLDEYIPSQATHQKVQLIMQHVVDIFCDMPTNVFFTAWAMNIETEDGEERVIPLIHGQKGALSIGICGLVDSFGYMKIAKNKAGATVRRINWRPNGAYIGKDRFDVLAPFTDDITLPEIERRILTPVGSKTAATPRRRRATTRRTA